MLFLSNKQFQFSFLRVMEMDTTKQQKIMEFLAGYDSLAIATIQDGQPFVTRVFYVEQAGQNDQLTLYGTFITSSRKLANIRENPRIGIFIGPQQPTAWLEATARADILTDENETNRVRELLAQKSSVAAGFIAQVPTAAVALHVNWLRITDFSDPSLYTEITFDSGEQDEVRG
jgi:nitroimidazol reductase NimA-like FMN-containing flavoprotein (pyridoxamine 5'-phosphate oxidase superfamily)